MSIFAVMRAELFRFARGGTTRWLLLLPALAAVVRVLGALVFERLEGIRVGGEAAIADGSQTTGFALLADALRTAGGVLAFIALVLGALSIVRDRETGVLALSFVARRRGSVVIAKAMALACAVVLGFALAATSALIVVLVTRGFAAPTIEGVEIVTAAELWTDLRDGALAALPPLIAAAWFGLAVSACADGGGFAVAAVIVPFVTFDVLKSAFPSAARYVFATWTPLLAEGSTLSRLTGLARGYANVDWESGELMLSCLVPALSGVVLLAVAVGVSRWRPA